MKTSLKIRIAVSCCALAFACKKGEMVECMSDADCGASRPLCVSGFCERRPPPPGPTNTPDSGTAEGPDSGVQRVDGGAEPDAGAGTSFRLEALGITENLNAAWQHLDSSVWIVGDNGTIRSYSPSTGSWRNDDGATTENLYGVWGWNNNHMFAVGSDGYVLRRDNTGWFRMSAQAGQIAQGRAYLDISGDGDFASDQVDYLIAVGEEGLAAKWTPALGWLELTTNVTADLRAVHVAGDIAVAVGDAATVLRLVGDTWTPVAGADPADYYDVVGYGGSGEYYLAGTGGTFMELSGSTFTSVAAAGATQIDLLGLHSSCNREGLGSNGIFMCSRQIYATGTDGSLFLYNGNTTEQLTLPTSERLTSIGTPGLIVGDNGTVVIRE